MIERQITKKLIYLSTKFPIVTITGPRQSGKTTIIKHIFKDYDYVSLEDPDNRILANTDPRGFLNNHNEKVIFDEIQNVPELLSYIQGIVDEKNEAGQFILSGSQSILLLNKISQSLAGRTALLKLLPFNLFELHNAGYFFPDYENWIFYGFFPRIYDQHIKPNDFYPVYLQTYIERDVRQIQNIQNLSTFIRFLKLCAGRIGQLIDYTSLANDAGISQNTAKGWMSVLEASYVIFLLQPYYKNFSKRVIKSPKLYFYDTGLASFLLNISDSQQLNSHYLKGGLFENFILVEIIKTRLNNGLLTDIYFWRDNKGNEADAIIENNNTMYPIEIKSGRTFNPDFFKNLKYWNKISGNLPEYSSVIYGGEKSYNLSNGNVYSWKNLDKLLRILSY
ncbi:MAG: ATP-binding protein [Bacteroidales bacterium]|jgi:predicted AAA+ superfamily ATPase|nr:ATP-binding protein [Bacteroidales bacterium]